jgi:hypothetical protein
VGVDPHVGSPGLGARRGEKTAESGRGDRTETHEAPTRTPIAVDEDVADEVVALITAGHSITSAATQVGVSRRSIQMWRRRAYSRAPEDAPYVAFEQYLQRALLAAARSAIRHVVADRLPVFQPLDELFLDLEA